VCPIQSEENTLSPSSYRKLAHILIDHSVQIKPGDRAAIWATTAAEPLVRELYALVLQRGGFPHLLLDLPEQDRLMFELGQEEHILSPPYFRQQAVDQFEAYIKINSVTDPRELTSVDPARQARRNQALLPLLQSQLDRGAAGALKWVATLYPTEGYAREAGMSLSAFERFVLQACHADEGTPDPIAYWKQVETQQQRLADRIQGHERVELRGPNVDLRLSIKDRIIKNASGECNMPDGEIYTGPVEDSANGWVRFTYPAIRQGRVVEGVELTFEEGKVATASAQKNEAYLLELLNLDPGARYLGEFAIGLNDQIQRFTGNILFDEKIGGTFHLALGAGYPETGSRNKSAIHWDMICDMREDSEILLDGEVIYRDGKFIP
jgi:aminopeptidase